MIKKFVIIVFLVASTLILYSQNYIYINDIRYEATNSWGFYLSGSSHDLIWLQVAKKNEEGYIKISKNTPDSYSKIGGVLKLYLDNGEIIKCYDKGIKDRVDNQSVVIYYLTKDEIKVLSRHRILKIRFSILNRNYGSSDYTAQNRIKQLSLVGEENNYKTEDDIKNLFNK